jgi:SAM-dependent methyltransferase
MTDSAAQDYSTYLRSRSSLGKLYRERWLYPRLCRLLKGATLDVGCGIGDMLAFRPEAVGVDINEHNVSYCRQHGLDAHLMPIDELPFAEATFDSVLLDNVLEHIADPSPLLKEIRRVLRKGGHVVIGVPGLRGQAADLDHKVFYDEESLRRLASRHGFKVEQFMYVPLWRSMFLSRRLRQYCVFVQWALADQTRPGS